MLHLPFMAGAGCSMGYGMLYTPLIPAYFNVRQCQLSLNTENTVLWSSFTLRSLDSEKDNFMSICYVRLIVVMCLLAQFLITNGWYLPKEAKQPISECN